ncbi:long-chain-fatty-acid--coa ligase [Anaeramoeba flamelloides]|uniref:Long-chain-fatty-acid--coa ligase n=1 Tax=Anaeramoeba flamelloides TaxID=1746091 RepID=A0AAV7YNF9_9EUKA|nr:long-chain-fatty-acid--coa ligase [Anaeramoeba flamelloides]
MSKSKTPKTTYITKKNDETIYRSSVIGDGELSSGLLSNVTTLFEATELSAKKCPKKPLFGKRNQLKDGKYGPYEWCSYGSFRKLKNNFGCGLLEKKIKPGDKLGIWLPNGLEWKIAEEGCYAVSLIPVSLYDTLGKESTKYIINHAEIEILVCNESKIEKLKDNIQDYPALRLLITKEKKIDQELANIFLESDIEILSMSAVIKMGKKIYKEDLLTPPNPDDIATIMYTSGTTGKPKGVILTHTNILAGVAGGNGCAIDVGENEVYISFLPLVHIFERCMHYWIITLTGRIGFYTGNIKNLSKDILELKPTIMAGVPRVFNRIKDAVLMKVESKGKISKWLFKTGYSKQKSKMEQKKESNFWNKVLFSKLKQTFGGRMKGIVSGGAPLSSECQEFLRVCFTKNVFQGYGLTETCACGAINTTTYIENGTCGSPSVCNEIKLMDVPEMNYYAKKHYGEICVRGYNVFQGYYKNEEETKKVLTEDGWFKTGDIGHFTKEGNLKIIDRKKNIVKLSQGEYVALEKLEEIYKTCASVSEIWIYADSYKNSLIAVIIPNFSALKIPEEKQKEICKDKEFKNKIQLELDSMMQEHSLMGFEKIKNVHLEHIPFTVENGLLTDTLKMKRFQLKVKYEKTIDSLYNELNKK